MRYATFLLLKVFHTSLIVGCMPNELVHEARAGHESSVTDWMWRGAGNLALTTSPSIHVPQLWLTY